MNDFKLYVHISPNNKMYFGITGKSIKERWRLNGKGYDSQLFSRAIQKYGWENFKHIVLFENLSLEVACECEKYLIAKFKTNNPDYGYNVARGGEYNSGFHFNHTEDAKRKISLAGKGKTITESQKQLISKAHKGKVLSSETKSKISNTVSEMMNDRYKKQISEMIKLRWKEGRYVNRKTNQVAWNKGLTKDDPRVAKYVRKTGEFHHTDTTRIKMSKSHKGKQAHNRKKVLCVETNEIYDSVSYATKRTGINNISKAARMNLIAGGYHWRYIDEN